MRNIQSGRWGCRGFSVRHLGRHLSRFALATATLSCAVQGDAPPEPASPDIDTPSAALVGRREQSFRVITEAETAAVIPKLSQGWDRYAEGTAPPVDTSSLPWTAETYALPTGWVLNKTGKMGYDTSVPVKNPDIKDVLPDTVGGARLNAAYARRTFNVASRPYARMNFEVWYDDGYVLYLNGARIASANMPTSAGTDAGGADMGLPYATFATATIALTGVDAATHKVSIPSSALKIGTNVLAVEFHQVNATSSDLIFDLEARWAVDLVRGPYLQSGSPTTAVVRWRGDVAADSQVRYGLAPEKLESSAEVPGTRTEHTVLLSGLTPNTKYYYAIGRTDPALGTFVQVAGDADHFFVTLPTTPRATRIWALGDAGTATASQIKVRDAYYKLAASDQRYTDVMLMLGDNAYNTGTDAEYQAAVFDMYPKILRQSFLWSAVGNHETAQASTFEISGPTAPPYFNIFDFPTIGQSGGVASGDERYYSFDYGSIHFVCLDSMTATLRKANSAQLVWLENDLQMNMKPWTIAFFHHPPYTKGSHNSDTEGELIEVRQFMLPVLEAHGVDVVLSGHSHSYERSYFINGHYQTPSAFTKPAVGEQTGHAYTISPTTMTNESYTKPAMGPMANQGAVYVVAGSSGQASGGTLNHPVMHTSLNQLGSLVIDVNGERLDARFLRENGFVDDDFSLVKGTPTNAAPTVTVSAPLGVPTTGTDAAGNPVLSAPVTLNATASDAPPGTVASVAFYINSEMVSADVTEPYTYDRVFSAPGTYQTYAIATDNQGATAMSQPVLFTIPTPPLLPPTGLTVVPNTSGGLLVSWTPVTYATGYRIERQNGATWDLVGEVRTTPTPTSIVETGLLPATAYAFRVRAFNATDVTAYTGPISGTTAATSGDTIVRLGSAFRYLDNNSNLGTTWRATSFDDSAWAVGSAPLGYAGSNAAFNTVVSFGGNSTAKFTTTYFRRTFSVNTPADYATLVLTLKRDDGAAVFINGTEVHRAILPADAGSTVFAGSVAVSATDTDIVAISPSVLVAGTNSIAVEIHQVNASSSDIYLDLSLARGSASPKAPSALVVTPVSTTQNSLTWTDNSTNEEGFQIERWDGNTLVITNVAANVVTFASTSTAGKSYAYKVRARSLPVGTGTGDATYSGGTSFVIGATCIQRVCGDGACRRTQDLCAAACVPGTPSIETCDGLDNDCNGAADDNLGTQTCGVGLCQNTVNTCAMGAPLTCTPKPVAPELCDGKDNNCDGMTDENLGTISCGVGACMNTVDSCSAGAVQACLPKASGIEVCDGIDNDCDDLVDEALGSLTCGVGECRTTISACVLGMVQPPQACMPGTPKPELCDGKDNDCDGVADEELGTTTCGVGECTNSIDTCVSGSVSTCTPKTAGIEVCDGKDNDCDGVVDQGLGTTTCGVGECANTANNCVSGSVSTCTPKTAGIEVCDGKDNDCDGVVDNGISVATCGVGACKKSGATCAGETCQPGLPTTEICNGVDDDCDGVVDNGLGGTLTCGVGACNRVVTTCVGGTVQACVPGAPTAEVCNGVDDDCDGVADNGFVALTCGVGECANTVAACTGGTAGTCTPKAESTEICDGKDNNCDGQTDENLPPISCGLGVCKRSVEACTNGATAICTPGTPSAEVCDGLDNDCDGMVDEGIPAVNCGVGACGRSVPACTNGQANTCQPGTPAAETCNGIDDDCDGKTDENFITLGWSCQAGVGSCNRKGVMICSTSGLGTICGAKAGTPSPEICDGKDNDCDGRVDNHRVCRR